MAKRNIDMKPMIRVDAVVTVEESINAEPEGEAAIETKAEEDGNKT